MTVTGGCGPAIEVRDLHKDYGDRRVLQGIDFVVERGEVFGLLGRKGPGKPTRVEILEGYRPATSGTVRVLGSDPSKHPHEMRERTGVVLQECGFPLHLRVGELLDAWRSYYRRPRPLGELLDVVELQADVDSLVRRLSGGQRRRLDLALALVGDPDLIFLDEPTTGFDPAARRTAWAVIQALKHLGKTVLLTTHYLDEAQSLSDRVAIVKDGVIVAEGPPAQLGVGGDRYRVAYDRNGSRVEVETEDPTKLPHRLTADAIEPGERLQGLTVARPTLEEVYLQLTDEADAE